MQVSLFSLWTHVTQCYMSPYVLAIQARKGITISRDKPMRQVSSMFGWYLRGCSHFDIDVQVYDLMTGTFPASLQWT